MAQNRKRVNPLSSKPSRKQNQFSVFNWLNRFLPLDKVFGETIPGKEGRVPIKYFYYVAWIVILLVIYEWIGFKSEAYLRSSIKLRKEVDDLRAEYYSIHADYMKSGKQSVIIDKVKSRGLEESPNPPQKIVVSRDAFDD